MFRTLFAVPLSALALIAFGCGGSDEGSSSPDASKPDTLVVSTGDLSGSEVINEPPPKTCGPVPIMEKGGAETAISKMLRFEGAKLVEAVGVFKTPAQAKAAYADLNTRRRFECIGKAIGRLGSAQGPTPGVETSTPQPLEAGDDGTIVHIVSLEENRGSEKVAEEEPNPVGASDVISVQTGRCAMALVVALKGPDSMDAVPAVSTQATEAAAERLSGVCG